AERSDCRLDAAAAGDVHAAGDHRLVGLGTALRVEELEREPALAVDAGALAKLGNCRVPLAALRDRDLEHLLIIELRKQTRRHEAQRCIQYERRSGSHHRFLSAAVSAPSL